METNLLMQIVRLLDIMESSDPNRCKAIIRANNEDENFVLVLTYLLGTKLPKIKRYDLYSVIYYKPKVITEFSELVDYLRNHRRIREYDLVVIRYYIEGQNHKDRETWNKIICREYKFPCSNEEIRQALKERWKYHGSIIKEYIQSERKQLAQRQDSRQDDGSSPVRTP